MEGLWHHSRVTSDKFEKESWAGMAEYTELELLELVFCVCEDVELQSTLPL